MAIEGYGNCLLMLLGDMAIRRFYSLKSMEKTKQSENCYRGNGGGN